MNFLKKISSLALLFCFFIANSCAAQIKNAKTETATIYGNCGMCEKKIENAGNLKNVAKVDWDKDTKIATITYNTQKTSKDQILKRIALAGYDNESYNAPDEVYSQLHGCCQYDRKETVSVADAADAPSITTPVLLQEGELYVIFRYYFELKDALVNTDGPLASAKAKEMLTAFSAVNMEKMTAAEHSGWMNVRKDLTEEATAISRIKDAAKQRDYFMTLSQNIYTLVKVSPKTETIYYDHCPMYNNGKGANWLSKENTIKNPYFGAKMLGCGSIEETIR